MDTRSSTLPALWAGLEADAAGRTFLVFEDRDGRVVEHTYGEFAAAARRTAALMQDLGVRHGDAVVLHVRNSPELLACIVGLAQLGAVAVPVHPGSTREECGDVVARVAARVVVAEPSALPAHLGGARGDTVEHLVLARSDTDVPGTLRYETERDAREPLTTTAAVASQDAAAVVFTSGTTARPKGVVLSHANLLFSGRFVDAQARLTAADRVMTTMPACHVNFLLNAFLPVLTAGATLVMVERYSAGAFWRQACDHRATVVQSIAMMVRTMLLQPAAEWERHSQVREVLYYLPITDEEKRTFEERFATRILNSYGTSETLVGVITDPPTGERRWPSIGQVGPGYEARVVDAAGRAAPVGAVGEIQVRGVPGVSLMAGYFRDPAATAAVYDPDGWFRTGDLGWVDEDGWFWFVERRTHLIKRSGEMVSPAEVEAALVTHPDVAEAAVVGVPDPIHDQAVKAFVVPAAGVTLDVDALRAHVRQLLAAFKVPSVVEVVPSLPQTRSFKVAKARLVEAGAAAHDTSER